MDLEEELPDNNNKYIYSLHNIVITLPPKQHPRWQWTRNRLVDRESILYFSLSITRPYGMLGCYVIEHIDTTSMHTISLHRHVSASHLIQLKQHIAGQYFQPIIMISTYYHINWYYDTSIQKGCAQ